MYYHSLYFQQAEVIRERTGYQVGHYCGEMGQDFWDARRWQREFETKQVRAPFCKHIIHHVYLLKLLISSN